MKIAISGKGGVGKTTIMALLAHHLKKTFKEVLVIDADPSPHMAQTLGIEDPEKVTAIADMKEMLRERSGYTDGSPFYNINPAIDDLPGRFMLEKDGIKLMVLGAIQTGNKGCACAENTVLKRLLTKLLLKADQAVLLDMEAGVEHLGRGTIAGVDHLLVVVIPSKSSARTALKIQKLAQDVSIPKISFVGNSISSPDDVSFLESMLNATLLTTFPDAQEIRLAERRGTAITTLASTFAEALQKITDAVGQ
ncbi:MAG: AAA family ATPase [Desulfobulbaceae bacterium]|nr:AAA family ATPase [Desulfobulbaceae bacterium]